MLLGFLPQAWAVNSTGTFDDILRNATDLASAIALWNATHSGPLAFSINDMIGFLRVPSTDPIWSQFPDSSMGPRSPHFELIWANAFVLPGAPIPPAGSFMSVFISIVSPASRECYLMLLPSTPLIVTYGRRSCELGQR